MAEQSKSKSEQHAINKIRMHAAQVNLQQLLAEILQGNTTSLARAITLTESKRNEDMQLSSELLQLVLPHAGNSIRVGITGVPGVGKSTFIDAFGSYLTGIGKKVAVLAIDPTSQISRGSILGDKTRMEKLASDRHAFIRPSPSGLSLGGVARKTREAIILCEAAGFDVILVETVGVGQSETAVHGMTDFFLLLMLAGAGDQLQGIKRGIMEMCDAMLITKADGDNLKKAGYAKAEYGSALHLFPARTDQWVPRVETCSALDGSGIENVWKIISDYDLWMKERNLVHEKRMEQDITWMHQTIKEYLSEMFYSLPETKALINHEETKIRNNQTTPFRAAEVLLHKIRFSS
jgi:LAO/AO transport system kinase